MAVWEYIDELHIYKVVGFTGHWIEKWYAKLHDFTQSSCVCIPCKESNLKKNCTAFTKINGIFLSDYCMDNHIIVYTRIRHPRNYSATQRTMAKGIFMTAEQNRRKCIICALPF